MPRRQLTEEPSTTPVVIPTMAPYFAANGPLASVIPGYETRAGQVTLAQAMAEAIGTKQHLIAEAGTGAGKSAAYLMALAATGVKAIVSTHTKALQQQLAEQEIPRLQHVLPQVTAAVLKGRSNYACRLSMDRIEHGERPQDLFNTAALSQEYQQLSNWLVTDGTHGDLDQLPFGISDELREKVTVDGYSCLGRKCPFLGSCYSQQAKEKAADAQIVIVNHTMLLLDLFLGKSVGLLPAHPVVVVDEAHALEDVATSTFGVELTAGRWRVLERKVVALATELQDRISGTHLGELVLDQVASVESRTSQLTAMAEGWFERLMVEMGEAKVRSLDGLLHEALQQAGQALLVSTGALQRGLKLVGEALKSGESEANTLDAERWLKLEGLADRTASWLQIALNDPENPGLEETPMVRYLEVSQGRTTRAVLKVKPIRVHTFLAEYLWQQRTVLATSATLATGRPAYGRGDVFAYWRERVGAQTGRALVIPSPFPFATSTRLYVPADGNRFDPTRAKWNDRESQAAYRQVVCEAVLSLIEVKRGGAFILCTSYAMVRVIEETVRASIDAEVFVQGDAPPAELLKRFKAHGQAVLIGTRTFWEGVDVPGDALSLVIIDRLPFGVPDDPLWEARCKDVGESWFTDLALPTTLIALKQAFGRLMRRMDDRGVIALLDGRLRSRSYGKWLLQGLPPSPLVGDVKEVKGFFERMKRECVEIP